MHKVKRKETIFSVSREYGISEQELIDANPELKKGMKKGQFLCIPYPAATTVQPGFRRMMSDVVTLYILEMEYKLCPFSMVCKK